jgi:BASS family bile acid:Na+ symporter
MFADVALPLALVFIMGSLGLTLTPADFRRVVTAPKGVGIGLVNLLLISPLLAFAVAEAYGLAAGLAVGVVLLGASPGGTTANMLTHLARGDVALSVSMTAVSSVASVLTVPLYLSLGAEYFDARDVSDEISMPGIAARVFLITIVPLGIGMLIRARRTDWALRNMGRARTIALVAFVIVVIGAVATEFDVIRDAFAEIAAAVITLNIVAMTLSFFIAKAAKLSNRQSTAIAMELGVHNTTVALAVATTVDDELTGPAAVYGLFMFVTAGLFARIMAKRNAPVAAERVQAGEQAAVAVPGSPETVWPAVATAAGLSRWLAPARLHGDTLDLDLGAQGTARGRLVDVDAPHRFAWVEEGWRDGAPPLTTAITLAGADGDGTRVAVATWQDGAEDPELDAAVRESWEAHLAVLRLHLQAGGGDATAVDVEGRRPDGAGDAWAALLRETGLDSAVAQGRGARVQLTGSSLAGELEHAGRRAAVVRLDAPAPGHLLLAADDDDDEGRGSVLRLQLRLHGPDAEEAAARERPAWESRLAGASPAALG